MNAGTLSLQTRAESAPTILARRQLLQSFRDPEYRRLFVEERVRASVALQIRALRQQRDMTQAKLGEAIGMAQTWVSKLEDPEYGKMTVATLLRLAGAFDADIEIKFRPYSRTLDSLPAQGPDYFYVPTFDEEFGSGESDSETIGRVRNIENIRDQGITFFGAAVSAGMTTTENANALASGSQEQTPAPPKKPKASALERTREDQHGNYQGSARQSSLAL
jgi:transcriptional regulator with XRE-family HTH domain